MSTERIDVLAAVASPSFSASHWPDVTDNAPTSITAEVRVYLAAVAELIEADREHDAAREALLEVNRRIAERGWLDLHQDALRDACSRFVNAQFRRNEALARVGGAA
jgi:hypothetical protein